MDAATLDKALSITGTVTDALSFGLNLPNWKSNPYYGVTTWLNDNDYKAQLLFIGTMTQPVETTAGGFDMDKVVIKGSTPGVDCHIYAQNENMIAWRTDQNAPMIISPDSICYMSKDGLVLSNSDITSEHIVGKEVGVFAITARTQISTDQNVMNSFMEAITNLGYPGPYKAWDQLAEVIVDNTVQ